MLYLENGNKLDINPHILKHIGSGAFGTVLKVNESKCLKILSYDPVHYDIDLLDKQEFLKKPSLIDKHMLIIKDNEYKNLSKIYELYYDDMKRLGGYLQQYLEKEYYSIQDLTEEYILNSFLNLLESSKKLSNQHILLRDTNTYNTILTREGVYLIDFDLYNYTTDYTVKELVRINQTQIIKLFNNLCLESLQYEGINNYVLQLYKLFNYEDTNRLTVFNNIIDKLSNRKVLSI